jgi:hypothetical protein
MKKYKLFLSGVLLIAFCAGISSCQKELMLNSGVNSGANAKADLTVGPLPVITWWSTLGTVPYTDNIRGDKPIEEQYTQGFTINGHGFLCGALVTSTLDLNSGEGQLFEFDPSTNGWIFKSSFPGDPYILEAATSFVIGDNAYIVAGNQTWRYNQPGDQWLQVASVSNVTERWGASSFAINGKGYFGLGWNPDAPGEGFADLDDWWEYDPTSNQWTELNNFGGSKRMGAGGFAIDGKGYVVGGNPQNKNDDANAVWQYDPTTDHWTKKTDYPGGSTYLPCAVNATIGGVDVGFIVMWNSCWQYNPATDSWAQVQKMPGELQGVGPGGFVIGNSLVVANLQAISFSWSR